MSIHWVRLVIQDLQFGLKRFTGYGLIDGVSWRKIEERTLNGDFAFRGLAACSQFSHHANSPGEEYTIFSLERNGSLPTDFETLGVGTASLSELDLYGERPSRSASCRFGA